MNRDRFGHVVRQVGKRCDAAGYRNRRRSLQGPEPIGNDAALTCVVLSPVSRLPYWSSTSTTGCVLKATPAVAVWRGLGRNH